MDPEVLIGLAWRILAPVTAFFALPSASLTPTEKHTHRLQSRLFHCFSNRNFGIPLFSTFTSGGTDAPGTLFSSPGGHACCKFSVSVSMQLLQYTEVYIRPPTLLLTTGLKSPGRYDSRSPGFFDTSL